MDPLLSQNSILSRFTSGRITPSLKSQSNGTVQINAPDQAEESLKESWRLARATGRLPSITFDETRKNVVVRTPGSLQSRRYSPGTVGFIFSILLDRPPASGRGLITTVQSYVGPFENGSERLSAPLPPQLSFRSIELGGPLVKNKKKTDGQESDGQESDGQESDGQEADGLHDGATEPRALFGSWEISKGWGAAIAVNVEISPECVDQKDLADFQALIRGSSGPLSFRSDKAFLTAVLCPSAEATNQQAKLSNSLAAAMAVTETGGRSCFPLTGRLHGHIDLSKTRNPNPEETKLVDIPCMAFISFSSPKSEEAVPELYKVQGGEGEGDLDNSTDEDDEV